jgi:hypothetical protein
MKKRSSAKKNKKSLKRSKRSLSQPARGWKKLKPNKTSERKSMLSRCGKKCFLLPSQLKFPICSKGSCKINCKGLVAAKNRAAQWKYSSVLKKASKMIDKRGFTKKSRSGKKKKERKIKRSKVKKE